MAKKKLKVLDLFAGAGGFSLGFDLVRDNNGDRVYEIVLAVENDRYACQTLKKYFSREYGNENIVLEADLTDENTHEKIIELCRDKVDVMIGGPPCQSFSLIGPRSGNGNGKNNSKYAILDKFYIEYVKLVKKLRPSFIIFENVRGIISKKDGRNRRYIDIISSDFRKLGYNFNSENGDVKTDYLILNAADYGVPQTRQRVFLIGNNLGIPNPYPERTHYDPKRVNVNPENTGGFSEYITLHQAIGDLPRVRPKITYTDIGRSWKKRIALRNRKIFNGKDRMDYHGKNFREHHQTVSKAGKRFLEFVRPYKIRYLTHHVARSQKRDDILLFRGMKQGMRAGDIFKEKGKNIRRLRKLIKYNMASFKDKYKKQSWDRPCSTVFAHLERDGNRFIHPDSRQARTFTPREAARVQSFPDYYEFEGPLTKKFRQIGNAVPPLLAMRIGERLYYMVMNARGG